VPPQPEGLRGFWPGALLLVGQRPQRVFSLLPPVRLGPPHTQPKSTAALLYQSQKWCTRTGRPSRRIVMAITFRGEEITTKRRQESPVLTIRRNRPNSNSLSWIEECAARATSRDSRRRRWICHREIPTATPDSQARATPRFAWWQSDTRNNRPRRRRLGDDFRIDQSHQKEQRCSLR
jgi:hypothetical protein